MIPIECPKCGREGNIPPDRMGSKLTCRGCQAIFHMDNSGRMMLGEPGSPEKKQPKVSYKSAGKDFDLAESLAKIPKPVRYGVPGALALLVAWLYLIPGSGGPDYIGRAEAVVRALTAKDRARAVSCGTPSTAASTGKWFDLMSGQMEKSQVAPDAVVSPALFSGNPETDPEVTLLVVLAGGSAPVTLNLYMKKDGGSWLLDGDKTLGDAEKAASANKGSR